MTTKYTTLIGKHVFRVPKKLFAEQGLARRSLSIPRRAYTIKSDEQISP